MKLDINLRFVPGGKSKDNELRRQRKVELGKRKKGPVTLPKIGPQRKD